MLFINRIVQGGIYFLTLPEDGKNRPYVVISNDNGYGLNVLVFSISSKYADSRAALPIVFSNKVSFMRTSSAIEVSPKEICAADFGGVVSPEILQYGISMFIKRFSYTKDDYFEAINENIEGYLTLLERKKYVLHENGKILFNVKRFLDNTLLSNTMAEISKVSKSSQKYPYKIGDWSTSRLKQFRIDMFKLTEDQLMQKYHSTPERVEYLKSHIKTEIKKRKGIK